MNRIPLHATLIILFSPLLWAGEIAVTGQGRPIADGDTSPTVLDGTDFGQLAAGGGTDTHTFVIHNEGTTALQFIGLEVDGPAFSLLGNHMGLLIQPDGTKSFDVRFDPTSAGIKTGTVTILSNDSNEGIYTFSITGEGLGNPEIDVRGSQNGTGPWITILDGDTSPQESDGTDFGDSNVGAPAISKTFQIHNTGDAQLTIDSITASNGNFTVSGVPTIVGVNQNQTFTLNFSPLSVGTKNTTITIRNNDPDEDPHTFTVTGEGISPEIKIRGFSQLIHNGDSTPSTVDGTNLGQVAAGGGSITREFKIHNDGNTELNLSAILETSNAFSITDSPNFATPIPPAGSVSFSVTFNPTSSGIKTTTIVVRSDAPSDDPYEFDVSGEGLGTPEMEIRGRKNNSSPWFTITKGSTSGDTDRGTNFPGTLVNGGLSTATFQIRNIGAEQITIDSITIDSPDYVAASIPAAVGVNQTKTFTIAFNPSAVGNESATVTVLSNDPDDSPFTFTLDGLGLADGPRLELRGGPDLDLLYEVTHDWARYTGGKIALTINELACDHSEGRPINHGDTTPSFADGTRFEAHYLGLGTVIQPADAPPQKPTQYFRLRNSGDADLTITGISYTGADLIFPHNEWAPQLLGQTLPPEGCATLPVDFVSPLAIGSNIATINITTNDPSQPLFQFDVAIEGLLTNYPSEIEVLVPSGNTLQNNGAAVDFGIVTSSDNSNTRTIRIQNNGGSTLTLGNIISDSSHFIVTPPAQTNLDFNEWVDFDIDFSPTLTREINGTVVIESDADNFPVFTLNVTGVAQGNGGPRPDPESELVLFGGSPMVRILPEDSSPSPLDGTDAGTFEVGDEITYTFRARNSGDVPLNFTRAPFILGTDIKATGLAPTIGPGEHDDFTISFVPRNPGAYDLRLILQSDAPLKQFSFILSATVNESPTVEAAGIEVIGFTLLDGDAFLNFNTPTGSTYRVVTNTDLGNNWNLVESGIPGGGFHSTYIFNGGTSEKRFFRIERE